MPSISLPAAIVGAGALGAGASLYAGSLQASAANAANALQSQMYNQNRADLQPWRETGSNALALLAKSLGVTPSGFGTSSSGTPTGDTPGVLAAKQAGPHSGSGIPLGRAVDPLGLFRKNASPIQDIAAALQQGRTVTDSDWAKAGYGPGGSLPGQNQGAANPQDLSIDTNALFRNQPGYEFAFNEGLRGVDQGAAARGMTRSGNTIKAEQRFGTGLADQTYNTWQNRLAALAGIGQTATGQGIQLGQNYATNSGSLIQDAAAQRASGYVGAGNAAGNALGQFAFLKGLGGAGGNTYTNAAGGLYNGSYLAPFNSEAAAMGF